MEGHKAKTKEKRTMTRTMEKGDVNANYLLITNGLTLEELTDKEKGESTSAGTMERGSNYKNYHYAWESYEHQNINTLCTLGERDDTNELAIEQH